jgi:hypothetical protein
MEEKKWKTMSESERNAMIDECFVYDDAAKETGRHVYYFTFHARKSVLNGILIVVYA